MFICSNMLKISILIVAILFNFTIFSWEAFSQINSLPVISICYKESSLGICNDWTEVQNSGLRFGEVNKNEFFIYLRKSFTTLHLKCQADYPIRWFGGDQYWRISPLNSTNHNQHSSNQQRPLYRQEFIVRWDPSQFEYLFYRCESNKNSTFSAGVYFLQRQQNWPYLEFFVIDDAKYERPNKSVIVPCIFKSFTLNISNRKSSVNDIVLLQRRGSDVQRYLPDSKIYNEHRGFSIPVDNITLGSTFECIDKAFQYYQKLVPVSLVTYKSAPVDTNLIQLLPDTENATMSWQFFPTQDTTSVVCRSPWLNSTDWAKVKLITTFLKTDVTSWKWIFGVGFAMLVIITLLVGVIVLSRKYQSACEQIKNMTLEEMTEFLYGDEACPLVLNGLVQVKSLGFNPDMRIDSSCLEINYSVILGEGQYGIVHSGLLKDIGEVAVKSSKRSADIDYFKAFLDEVKIMAFIGDHRSIVKFYGAVVENIETRECMAVIELSPYGNLNQYLLSYSTQNATQNTEPSTGYASAPGGSLSPSTLLSFCEQIALAMEYLSDKKVIHGDLATRNVLVFSNHLVKITDFGLSRKLYSCHYVKSNQVHLPWPWMAMESLRYFKFSIESDVWSFGVTVWEIFSQGAVPYLGVEWTPDFVDKLEAGLRLTKPKLLPPTVFDWMMKCWQNSPYDRPSFTNCKDFFRKFLEV